MKRFLTLLFLLFIGCGAFAQHMNVASFEILENDLDARVHYPKRDFNGSLAALIKIETTVKGLFFDCGSIGIVDVDNTQVAETWVYIPFGATRITIKHAELGIIRDYEFPISIKAATVYKMQLTTAKISQVVSEDVGGQFLVLNVVPEQALLTIDDGLPCEIEGGVTTQFLSYGKHNLTVSAPMYESYSAEVEIMSERVNLDVELKPNFGFVTVRTNPNAKISIDGEAVGSAPINAHRLALGEHTIVMSAAGYESVTRTVVIDSQNNRIEIDEALECFMPRVDICTAGDNDLIYVNDVQVASGVYSELMMPGSYHLRVSSDGYRDKIMRLDVVRNVPQRVNVEALEPKFGTLRVESNVVDAQIKIDGQIVGSTPNVINDVLATKHTVSLSKDGYDVASREVVVSEGKISSVNISMNEKRAVSGWVQNSYVPSVQQTPKREKTKLMTNISWIGSLSNLNYTFTSPTTEETNVSSMLNGFMLALARENGAYVKCMWGDDTEWGNYSVSGDTYNDYKTYYWDDYIKTSSYVVGYTRRLTGDESYELMGIYGYVGLGYEKQTINRVCDDSSTYRDIFTPDPPITSNRMAFDIGLNLYFCFMNLTLGYYTTGDCNAFQIGYGTMF